MSAGSTHTELKLGSIPDFKHVYIEKAYILYALIYILYIERETQTGQNQFNTEREVFREATQGSEFLISPSLEYFWEEEEKKTNIQQQQKTLHASQNFPAIQRSNPKC